MKIAVALSGGVDSTAVAWRLKQAGHELIGLTMRLCPETLGSTAPGPRAAERARPGLAGHGCTACSAPCACVDATAAARQLGIPHEILDLRPEFEAQVIQPFLQAYLAGRTPNPCAGCNREMKFGRLADAARALGAEAVATGHYARLRWTDQGPRVERAADRRRDQTYFMALVPTERFRPFCFPLGDSEKTDVQQEVSDLGVRPDPSPTSTEICFLHEGDYLDFVRQRHPEALRPGEIVDASGRVLGEHLGLAGYTIGQRKGLGVAAAEALYVLALDPGRNQVVVGPDEALFSRSVELGPMNWIAENPGGPMRVQVMLRYRQIPLPAILEPRETGGARLTLDQPARAITPGQVAALYQDNQLVGGAQIQVTEPRPHA